MAINLPFLDSHYRAERLPNYGHAYLSHVLAGLFSLSPESVPTYVTQILDKYKANPDSLTWGDLYMLEKYVLSIQPKEELRRKAWVLRSDFLEMAGAKAYQLYLQSQPPNENDPNCDISALRADLDRILDSLHWSYSLIPIRERLRAGVVRDVGLVLLLSIVAVLALVYWCSFYHQTLLAWILLVMLAGSAGGFVSLQQRAQNVPTEGDPLVSIFELENGRFSIYLAPVSGAIFAVVLLALFMGGLVSGELFPDFSSSGGLKYYIKKFEWADTSGGYLGSIGYAKLMVWSFIAGFAERFVPDTLDRLIARAQTAGSTREISVQPTSTSPPAPSVGSSPPTLGSARRLSLSPPLKKSPPWI
jgi:hypothetical protein